MRRFLLLAASCMAANLLIGQPKFSIDKMELDLGVMYSGTTKTGRYTIKNVGTEPLQIKYVQPSCGCTTVRRPQDWIQPGKTDFVDIEFNSVGMHGKVEKYVYISTNDPTAKDVNVKLFGEVREELESTSPIGSMPMGGVTLGKEIQQTMTFKNISGHVIKIKEISTSGKGVRARANKMTIDPADSVAITVIVVPDKEGYSFDHVVLQTDSNNQPKIEIRVSYIGVKEQ